MQIHQITLRHDGHIRQRRKSRLGSILNVFCVPCIVFALPIVLLFCSTTRLYSKTLRSWKPCFPYSACAYKPASWRDDYPEHCDLCDQNVDLWGRGVLRGASKSRLPCLNPTQSGQRSMNDHAFSPATYISPTPHNPHHRPEQLCFGLAVSFSYPQEYHSITERSREKV